MSGYRYSESVVVRRSPETVYAMVSDVTRTGEWSPICTACWWETDDGPEVGATFTGRNEIPGRTWETRSTVTVAEPGREFAFEVGDGFVRWSYAMAAVDGGTELTESWAFLPAGLAMFRAKFGEQAEAEITDRTEAAHRSIPVTLAAVKRIAEDGASPPG